MKRTLGLVAAVFFLVAVIFFGVGMHKIKVYDTYYPYTNSYVGGDAYNYIINGTYFAGYSALAGGCLVAGALFAVGAVLYRPEQPPVVPESKIDESLPSI